MTKSGKIHAFVEYLDTHADLFAAGIILLVFAAGGLYAWFLGNQLRFLPDEQDYLQLANHLLSLKRYTLDGITPSAYRPPGYVWFLAVFRLAGGQVWHLRVAGFLLLAVAMLAEYLWLKRDGSPFAGLVALLITGGYAVLFFTAGTLYPQTLAAALILWSLYLFSAPGLNWARGLLAGVLLGWAVLTVPLVIFIAPLALGWGIWRRFSASGLWAFVLGGVLLLGGWTIRNAVVFGDFVFISTNGGENFLIGNNANTTPNGGTTIDISRHRRIADGMDELAQDRYYRSQAWAYIRTHPAETLRMYALKTLTYFHYRNDLVTKTEASKLRDLIMLLTYLPLLFLFVIRLLVWRKYPFTPSEWLWVLIYLASALVTAVFFPRIRFRLPFDYFLILTVAAFLTRWGRAHWLDTAPA